MAELPPVDPDAYQLLFEPYTFNEEHGPLTLAAYGLSAADLKSWSERCTTLRSRILSKAKQYMPEEPEPVPLRRHRGRKLGEKIPKSEDKPEGLSEKGLRTEYKKD